MMKINLKCRLCFFAVISLMVIMFGVGCGLGNEPDANKESEAENVLSDGKEDIVQDKKANTEKTEADDSLTTTESATKMDGEEKNSAQSEAAAESEVEEKTEMGKDSNSDIDVKKQQIYEQIISDGFSGFGGEVNYGLHMYGSDVKFVNKSSRMKSASVIKLFIMEYAYDLMNKGEVTADTIVDGKKLVKLIESMITVSDNGATNSLIDYFGMDNINEFIVNNYSNTTLQRRMLDSAAAARGEENYTSVSDVMLFLDKLYANKEVYPYDEMLNIMKKQQISTKLRRNMLQGVVMASKTGELSDVENDVAIVFTDKGDYAIVCLTKGGSSDFARNAMAKICRNIYDELYRK